MELDNKNTLRLTNSLYELHKDHLNIDKLRHLYYNVDNHPSLTNPVRKNIRKYLLNIAAPKRHQYFDNNREYMSLLLDVRKLPNECHYGVFAKKDITKHTILGLFSGSYVSNKIYERINVNEKFTKHSWTMTNIKPILTADVSLISPYLSQKHKNKSKTELLHILGDHVVSNHLMYINSSLNTNDGRANVRIVTVWWKGGPRIIYITLHDIIAEHQLYIDYGKKFVYMNYDIPQFHTSETIEMSEVHDAIVIAETSKIHDAIVIAETSESHDAILVTKIEEMCDVEPILISFRSKMQTVVLPDSREKRSSDPMIVSDNIIDSIALEIASVKDYRYYRMDKHIIDLLIEWNDGTVSWSPLKWFIMFESGIIVNEIVRQYVMSNIRDLYQLLYTNKNISRILEITRRKTTMPYINVKIQQNDEEIKDVPIYFLSNIHITSFEAPIQHYKTYTYTMPIQVSNYLMSMNNLERNSIIIDIKRCVYNKLFSMTI